MNVRFCPLVSGSSGNSTYIGNGDTHILIDAGVSCKQIVEHIRQLDIEPENINAIFITHEHIDHIKGAGVLSRKYNIPVYATPGTWQGIGNTVGDFAPENVRYVSPGQMMVVGDLCVKPFAIPHDTIEPVAYSVFTESRKLTVATDIGHATDIVKENIYDSDVLLFEANHDIDMLKNGSYPWPLKQRILGEKGHLSNEASGETLGEIMNGRLKYIFLGHLSKENNEPHLCYETVNGILDSCGIKTGKHVQLDMASRFTNSMMVEL
ncbi:MAG: MBL fold metallo-hydrolase [Clostridiales bacterium]|nr:MBL fold metallo-hydrolase [Clostridiales bacterium]